MSKPLPRIGTISTWNPFAFFNRPAPTEMQIREHDLGVALSAALLERQLTDLKRLEIEARIVGLQDQLTYVLRLKPVGASLQERSNRVGAT